MLKNRPADSGIPAAAEAARFIKKGLGSCSPLTSPAELGEMRLGWYYNWRPFEKIAPVQGVEFVPMFWSGMDVTSEILAEIDKSAATHALGFNEPDLEGQSNMTPDECLAAWPQLMTLKQRLGSPAPADWNWLDKFMPEANRRGLRVDFVCVHRYPDFTRPDAVDEIEAMLQGAYQKYGLPVWLTETGAADVAEWHQVQFSEPTPELARSFMKKLLAMLESLPFVERYAWFADRVGKTYAVGTIFEVDASPLTPLGEVYRAGG